MINLQYKWWQNTASVQHEENLKNCNLLWMGAYKENEPESPEYGCAEL